MGEDPDGAGTAAENRSLVPGGAELAPRPHMFLPVLIERAGPSVAERFLEFFAVSLRNAHTRRAYVHAVARFLDWCAERDVRELAAIRPMLVAAYIEQHPASKPTVKLHLAAIRMCFDWLVTGGHLGTNPAAAVRGPTHRVRQGKTPVLSAEEARRLLESIPTEGLRNLRDRALFAVMLYTFARVGAATRMCVQLDYFRSADGFCFRLHEKGGQEHVVPAHPKAEQYLNAYLDAAGIQEQRGARMFRIVDREGHLTEAPMTPNRAYKRVQHHARRAGLETEMCCHTFRATGITEFRRNGGTLEQAQLLAGHAQPQTTQLYDHSQLKLSREAIQRIRI